MNKTFQTIRKTWAFNPKTRVKPVRGEKVYRRSDSRKIERESF